jgi:hypothetical protein
MDGEVFSLHLQAISELPQFQNFGLLSSEVAFFSPMRPKHCRVLQIEVLAMRAQRGTIGLQRRPGKVFFAIDSVFPPCNTFAGYGT